MQLIETLADYDEEVAEYFLAEEEIDGALLKSGIRRATLSLEFSPGPHLNDFAAPCPALTVIAAAFSVSGFCIEELRRPDYVSDTMKLSCGLQLAACLPLMCNSCTSCQVGRGHRLLAPARRGEKHRVADR